MTPPATAPADVRRALLDRAEIALLDVRPEGLFAAGHPLFAASFPLGRLEAEAYDRLPRRSVPVAVYGAGDEHGDEARTAAARLAGLGYHRVSLLAGGLGGWSAAGGELFRDVNAPSKAFGELVEATAGTPALDAAELSALLGGHADVVVLDARRYEEYQTMSIPTATSVPGAELVLRVGALAPDPATLVVVNCAGRTRSIIGTQSLINAGTPNRVLALRNGTIGWTLAGLQLERGQDRRAPAVPDRLARQAAAAASAVAARAGVRQVRAAELESLARDGRRTIYRFDVRTPGEYAAGHLAGFRSAPGGQLVQETDWFAPVRGALVVLAGDEGGRAAMTASWLAQMGWDTAILAGGAATERGPWVPARPEPPAAPLVRADQLAEWLEAGQTRVIDIATSTQYLAGHLPGSAWALRTEVHAPVPGRRLVLTSPDGLLAAFAAADLAHPGVYALADGTAGWARSGRPLETGPAVMLSPAVDVYRRPYEGTGVDPAAMQAYLDWEHGLVAQLARDGTHGFTVLAGKSGESNF